MAQIEGVLLCAAIIFILGTATGLPLARLIVPPAPSWLLAPALGFATVSVVALALCHLAGITQGLATVLALVAVGISFLAARRQQTRVAAREPRALVGAAIAAGILALGPMAAVLPKAAMDGVTLASPIFDHAKIALIDEIIRGGVPLGNPFFAETAIPDRIAYYYLWHFAAAAVAVIAGASGWEADAALTWYTGFAFLTTAMGLAVLLSGRIAAAFLVLALAAPASARFPFESLWPTATAALIGSGSGLGGWLYQTSWAPQHVMSATCVVLACALLYRIADRDGWIAPIVLGLVAAAGFQSSVWVGGVVFVLAAVAIVAYLLVTLDVRRRLPLLLRVAMAAVIAAVLSASFIVDQVAMTVLRGGGGPVAITPVAVLSDAFPQTVRRLLDLPAYWLIYLPVELPVIFVAGVVGLVALLRQRTPGADARRAIRALGLLTLVSLLVAWLLRSIVAGNNDLGWRAILPAVMLLTVFAAAAIVRWPVSPARICAALATLGAILAAPHTVALLRNNLRGDPLPSAHTFAAAPQMWAAVRRHAGVSERIANNPLYLANMTPWPVNISWALMANRRSCYAGKELAIPFAPIPAARREVIEAQFVRVFAGEAAAGDIEELATRFQCDVIVVTPQDGAWQRDPFATGTVYRLVETQPDAWRIYRRAAP